MKILLLFLSLNAFAEVPIDKWKEQEQLQAQALTEGWTFDFDSQHVGKYSTGYVKPANQRTNRKLRLGEGVKLKSMDLADFGVKLTPIMNQGSCGSCVVFSILANFMDSLRLREYDHPMLSPQHLMNCGTGGQCNGAYGSQIAGDLVRLKTIHKETDYPYTARTGGCQRKQGDRFGIIESFEDIDGSPRTILAALHAGKPASVSVAANNSWMSYRSGIYNACNSNATNHYVVIQAVDCGTSVDKDGYCIFDDRGNLPPGVGTYLVRNSWGTGWGENGYMRTRITNSQGRKCNAIAGEGEILETGLPMKPKDPVSIIVESKQIRLQVVIQPTAKYTSELAKAVLLRAINSLDGESK